MYLLGLLAEEPASWEAGDLVEILPLNGQPRIDAFLKGMALDASARVQVNGLGETLAQALAGRQLPARRDQLIGLQPQALVDALVPIGSREYSIASIASDARWS